MAALVQQLQQLAVVCRQALCLWRQLLEKALFGILLQRGWLARGQPDRDRDALGLYRRWNDELGALPGRESQRDQRLGRGNALAGLAFVDDGGAEMAHAFRRQAGHRHALPAGVRLQEQLAGAVDADFGHVRPRQVVGNAEHLVLVLQKAVGQPGQRVGIHGVSTPAKSISRATWIVISWPCAIVMVGARVAPACSAVCAADCSVSAVRLW